MRIKNKSKLDSTYIWLSENDTYNWAHKEGASWPCSQLSGKRLYVEIAPNGDLLDYKVNGKLAGLWGNELDSIIRDHLGTIARPQLKPIASNLFRFDVFVR